jgi:hypothetical protein
MSESSSLFAQDPPYVNSVQDAIAALETAEGVVPAHHLVALRDPGFRAIVEEHLASHGRVLLNVEHDGIIGYASGYQDDVADELSRLQIGTLNSIDRAVLALVLLKTVAIPRAHGRHSHDRWLGDARPVSFDELCKYRYLSDKQLRESLRRLRTIGLLRLGHRGRIEPGLAFLRLTPRRSATLWEDLIIACDPKGPYARLLIRQRNSNAEQPVDQGGEPG